MAWACERWEEGGVGGGLRGCCCFKGSGEGGGRGGVGVGGVEKGTLLL